MDVVQRDALLQVDMAGRPAHTTLRIVGPRGRLGLTRIAKVIRPKDYNRLERWPLHPASPPTPAHNGQNAPYASAFIPALGRYTQSGRRWGQHAMPALTMEPPQRSRLAGRRDVVEISTSPSGQAEAELDRVGRAVLLRGGSARPPPVAVEAIDVVRGLPRSNLTPVDPGLVAGWLRLARSLTLPTWLVAVSAAAYGIGLLRSLRKVSRHDRASHNLVGGVCPWYVRSKCGPVPQMAPALRRSAAPVRAPVELASAAGQDRQYRDGQDCLDRQAKQIPGSGQQLPGREAVTAGRIDRVGHVS